MNQLIPNDILNLISLQINLKTVRLVNKHLYQYNKCRYCQNLINVTQEEMDKYKNVTCYGYFSSDRFELTTPMECFNIKIKDIIIMTNYKKYNKNEYYLILDFVNQLQIYKNRNPDDDTFHFYKNKILKRLHDHILMIYNTPFYLKSMYVWLFIHSCMIDNDMSYDTLFNHLHGLVIDHLNRYQYQKEAKRFYDKLVHYIKNL